MAINQVETPGIPSGNEKQQLEQMYRYMARLADDLNISLKAIGGNELTDEERTVMQQILVRDAEDAGIPEEEAVAKAGQEMESLKSLIIKTAKFVQTTLQEYRLNLLRDTVAEGQFGKYVRRTGLDMVVTPEGIRQNYTLQDIVEGLSTYEVNAKNYIKTGLLRTVSSIPVYGVAIGKDVVTFQQDGTEIYNDGNKVAELTADELSFYYNGSKVFYISTGKIYAAGDLEISSGKTLKIVSGGNLDINTTNFKIDSENRIIETENWLIDDDDIRYKRQYQGQNIDLLISTATQGNVTGILIGSNYVNKRSGFRITDTTIYGYTEESNPFTGYGNIGYDDWPVLNVGTRHLRVFEDIAVYNENDTAQSIPTSITRTYIKAPQIRSNNIFIDQLNTGVSPVIGMSDHPFDVSYITNGYYNKLLPISGNNTGSLGNSSNYWKEAYIGTIYQIGGGSVNVSSREKKHNIKEMKPPGERLDQLKPVTFIYNDDKDERTRQGLIYEDTVEVMPEICTKPEEEVKGINYAELIPMLLKEIQLLRARVKKLEEGK